jgi:DNA-binding NtrC family response regulator
LNSVAELTHATAELIYLVPADAMNVDYWPQMRVRMAQSNRFYLAYMPHASTAAVVRCLRDGAHDVLSLEDTDQRWREAIDAAVENQRIWLQLYGGNPISTEQVLIGKSEALRRLRQTIERLGATDVCVLLQGESGVGKERVASALHGAGKGGPYIALNCAAIPKELLESELFGVEKGAYTGAHKSREGLVEQAHGGTLFLDEIGEMELSLQPKLLRFLETRRARRVGGDHEYSVNVRVISATNRKVEDEVNERRFRADLYFRLAEIILQIPPLRTRLEDIPELAVAFMRRANERFGKNFEMLEPGLIEKFQHHIWPGNVRELKSVVDRLVLLYDGPLLREDYWDLPISGIPETGMPPAVDPAAASPGRFTAQPQGVLPSRAQRRELARQLLQNPDMDLTSVAAQVGVHPTTLFRWRKTGRV